jgi:hypothetical protein
MDKLVIGTLMLVSASAIAGETPIGEKQVPRPVLEAIAKKYPTAKRAGFTKETDEGKTTYEVQIVDSGRKIDVDVTPEGKISAEEETITVEALPPAVRQALARSVKYGKWTIERAERIIKDENVSAPTYELVVAGNKHSAEIVFDPAGNLVKEEPKK